MTTSKYICPQEGCSLETNDLGYFVEHISGVSRKELIDSCSIDKKAQKELFPATDEIA